jgi:hypothetical protein
MKKVFRERLVSALFLLIFSGAVQADGVAIPREGGFLVLNGDSLTEARTVEMGGADVPKLAVHPSSPILAGLSEDRLTFWNLPSFAEASRHQDSLFKGVVDIDFSDDGTVLYLLSAELRAVIKFDLSSSQVSGTLPVPGGQPLWLQVHAEGVLVGQEHSVSLLSADAEKGLLSQFRFPERITSALVKGQSLFLTRVGSAGVDTYEARTGRAIGFLPTASTLKQLIGGVKGDGLYALSGNGAVQAWSADGSRPRWTFPAGALSFDAIVTGGSGSALYAFDQDSQVLVALDSGLGKESARVNLGGVAGWKPVVFSGTP